MKITKLVLCFKMMLILSTSSLFASSTFIEYSGQYSIVYVFNASEIVLQKGDKFLIQSSESEAIAKIYQANTNLELFFKKMFEYDYSGEGRISSAQFYKTENGASWVSNSTSSIGSSFELEHLENDLYVLKALITTKNPYYPIIFNLLIKKEI